MSPQAAPLAVGSPLPGASLQGSRSCSPMSSQTDEGASPALSYDGVGMKGSLLLSLVSLSPIAAPAAALVASSPAHNAGECRSHLLADKGIRGSEGSTLASLLRACIRPGAALARCGCRVLSRLPSRRCRRRTDYFLRQAPARLSLSLVEPPSRLLGRPPEKRAGARLEICRGGLPGSLSTRRRH